MVVVVGVEELEVCALLPKPHRLPVTSPSGIPHKGNPHPWEKSIRLFIIKLQKGVKELPRT